MELETLLERLHLDSKCNYKERIEKLKRKTNLVIYLLYIHTS